VSEQARRLTDRLRVEVPGRRRAGDGRGRGILGRMPPTATDSSPARVEAVPATGRRALVGLALAAVVVLAAMVVPGLFGVDVQAGGAEPLLGDWVVRVGWSSLVALAVLAVTAWSGLSAALDRLTWRRLLLLSWVVSLVWMVALALVDGPAGLGRILDHPSEYLQSARATDDVGALLREYVSRIPDRGPGTLPTHLAGHPPGAVLMFVALDRLGLGSWQAAGLVVVLVAATLPAGVATTLDRLGARDAARRALPFLVVGPAAVLMAVSADALFATTAAWAAAALAAATAARTAGARTGLAVLGGLLFGWCVMESYGLALIGLLAVAVLLAGPGSGRGRLTVAAVGGVSALAVVLAFVPLGFAWWEAYPALHERYWAGIASTRPAWYWVFGNLGALLLVAGPVLPAALGAGAPRLRALVARRRPEPVAALVAAGVAMVAVADLSLMSKAEVERIWLPFLPWMLLAVVWLPERWRRWGLLAQAVAAVLLQHLVRTLW
jgi:methylthioxylose transferase